MSSTTQRARAVSQARVCGLRQGSEHQDGRDAQHLQSIVSLSGTSMDGKSCLYRSEKRGLLVPRASKRQDPGPADKSEI